MSKFYVSNFGNHLDLRKDSNNAGFSSSAQIDNDAFRLSIFRKLSIQNENILTNGNDFVANTGTLLVDGCVGFDALKRIAAESTLDVTELRKIIKGNYAAIIKRGNSIIIFGEQTYAYDIFYYNKNGEWIVTNDLFSLEKYNQELISVNENNIIEYSYLNAVIGNETILNDVYRISGEQYIEIDLESNSLSIRTIEVDWKSEYISYDQSVTNAAKAMEHVAQSIHDAGLSTAVCMTGGVDSRLTLSALLKTSNNPILYYGEGNSLITNTHSRDYEIDTMFAEKYNLKLQRADWSTPMHISESWEYYINKYGYLSLAYQSPEELMKSYEQMDADCVMFGYFGELLRNIWVRPENHFTINNFVDDYYFRKNDASFYICRFVEDFPLFRSHILSKFTNVCMRFDVDPNDIKPEDEILLGLEYRANADTLMLNLCNRIRYCTILASESEVIRNSYIPTSLKESSKYMLSIMEQLYPSVLTLPFFSHQTNMIYDKRHNSLTYPIKVRFRKGIGKLMPKNLKQWLLSYRQSAFKANNDLMPDIDHTEILASLTNNYDISFVSGNCDLRPLLHHSMCKYVERIANGAEA